MKRLILFLLLCAGSFSLYAQQESKPEDQIRRYWFVMLTKGPKRNQDSVTRGRIMQGHLANIERLYQEGKIKVAGPFEGDENWQGIFIFDCDSKAEVEQLLKTDPAIKAGRLNFIIKEWWTAPIGSFIPGKPKSTQQ